MTHGGGWAAVVMVAGAIAAWSRLPAGPEGVAAAWISALIPGPHLVPNTLGAAWAVLAAAGLFTGYAGAGLRVARWTGRRRPGAGTRTTAPLTGYAAVSLILLGLAAVGLWHRVLLAGAALLLVAAIGRSGRRWFGALLHAGLRRWRGAGVTGRAAAVALALWGAVLLVPPGMNADCLEYHLTFPAEILKLHRLPGGDGYLYWAWALASDLPNVFPLLAGDDAAAALLRPLLLLSGAAALGGRLGVPIGWVWIAVLLPAGTSAYFTAKNDAVVAGFVLAGAAAVSGRRPGVRSSLLAGFMLGAALASKVIVLPVTAALAVLLAVRADGRRRPRVLSGGLVAAAVPVGAWAVKSLLIWGDPSYPAGTTVFPRLFGEPADGERLRDAVVSFIGVREGWARWPLEAAWLVAAGALPVVAVGGAWRRAAGGGVALAGLAGTVALVAGLKTDLGFVSRFCAPALAMANVAAVAWMVRGRGAGWRLARTGLIAAGVAAHARIAGELELGPATVGVLSGTVQRAGFRADRLQGYGGLLPVIDDANRRSGRRGRMLAIGETISWGLPVPVVGEGFGPRFPWRTARRSRDVRRIGIAFRQADIRWILYNPWKADWRRWQPAPWTWNPAMLARWREFNATCIHPLRMAGSLDRGIGNPCLFEVTRRPRPGRERAWLPGAEQAFGEATRSGMAGRWRDAERQWRGLKGLLPGVAAVDRGWGEALLWLGRDAEAYARLRAARAAGYADYSSLTQLAVAAERLGRPAEAERALREAGAYLRNWPGAAPAARRAVGR